MKKIMVLSALIFFLMVSIASAQTDSTPFLQKGVQELALSGSLDFEGPSGGVDFNLTTSYGFFIANNWEIGGFLNYTRQDDGDFQSYGVGGFAEYHFTRHLTSTLVPYAGVNLGFQFTEADTGDDEAGIIMTPKVGIKWFLQPNIAIDTNLFVALATDDVFLNDGDLDKYDWGIALGLRVYFK
jgi:hypothetical protein